MVINFLDFAEKYRPALLMSWHNSSDGVERIASINDAPQYRQAKAKRQAEKDRQAANKNVLNHFGIFK